MKGCLLVSLVLRPFLFIMTRWQFVPFQAWITPARSFHTHYLYNDLCFFVVVFQSGPHSQVSDHCLVSLWTQAAVTDALGLLHSQTSKETNTVDQVIAMERTWTSSTKSTFTSIFSPSLSSIWVISRGGVSYFKNCSASSCWSCTTDLTKNSDGGLITAACCIHLKCFFFFRSHSFFVLFF